MRKEVDIRKRKQVWGIILIYLPFVLLGIYSIASQNNGLGIASGVCLTIITVVFGAWLLTSADDIY